jgi:hypothetical protein
MQCSQRLCRGFLLSQIDPLRCGPTIFANECQLEHDSMRRGRKTANVAVRVDNYWLRETGY